MKAMPNDPQLLLEEMSRTLDELIECQHEEQELILSRRANDLPEVTNKMQDLTQHLQRCQAVIQAMVQRKKLPAECEPRQQECVKKFSRLQDLTLQNHLLLENSLEFLKDVFHVVLGSRRQSDVYNPLGLMLPDSGDSGNLLEAKA